MGYTGFQKELLTKQKAQIDIERRYLDFVNKYLAIGWDFDFKDECYTDEDLEKFLVLQDSIALPAMSRGELKDAIKEYNEKLLEWKERAADEDAQYFYLQEKHAQEKY